MGGALVVIPIRPRLTGSHYLQHECIATCDRCKVDVRNGAIGLGGTSATLAIDYGGVL